MMSQVVCFIMRNRIIYNLSISCTRLSDTQCVKELMWERTYGLKRYRRDHETQRVAYIVRIFGLPGASKLVTSHYSQGIRKDVL